MQRYTVYLEAAVHVSGRTSAHHQERKQLSTASGICQTVTAICRYRGRGGTGLSVLWVACYRQLTYRPYSDFSRKEAHCPYRQGFSIEGTGPQPPEHLCDNPRPLIILHMVSTDLCCHASHAHAYVGGHAHTRTRTGLGEAFF